MSYTLTTSGAIIAKAGENVNSTAAASGSLLVQWSDEAEGFIAAATRRSWVADYSGVDAEIKEALDDCASSLAAMKLINYDMSGYTSRSEAQTMLDVLRDNAMKIIEVLKDFKSNSLVSP